MEINTKKQLTMILSQLKGFEKPKMQLEQYETVADFAAEIVWYAFYRREISDKVVAYLVCGTGILGLSTLLIGAKKVFIVDIDKEVLATARENLKFLEKKLNISFADSAVFVNKDVSSFDEKVDTVYKNPPFGIKSKKHADKVFLENAFKISKLVYSFHKAESKEFIEAVSKDNKFKIEGYWEFDWPLKQTMKYHKKKIEYIKVGCWRLISV